MRLGFAVAAHLEVEIMLVDEVSAVGDSAPVEVQGKDPHHCSERQDGVVRES
jgi:ABC-type polysaccharide/polyol phosphate transport system ATPase subunit